MPTAEEYMRAVNAPEEDKAAVVDAVNVLIRRCQSRGRDRNGTRLVEE
jgi:hypothetical protein